MSDFVIASRLTVNAINLLSLMGLKTVSLDINSSLPPEIAHHTDLSFFDCEDGNIFIANEAASIKNILTDSGYNVRIISERLGTSYFDCVRLNCVAIGNKLICNPKTVSKDILNCYKAENAKIIAVKQGYTRCSVVPVTENALITDDESIYNACINNDIEALLISKGSVALPGYDYGFIGGTAGKLSKNIILFNGNLMRHADAAKIYEFLAAHSVYPISLCDTPLTDIGGIFTIKRRNYYEEKQC